MLKRIAPNLFGAVCSALGDTPGAKTAIKIIDEKTIVKATYRFKPKRGNRREEMVVTFGEPDYLTEAFIKRCKKAGEPFPVKKIQFRFYAVKKRGK
jgi:hypothetical protein